MGNTIEGFPVKGRFWDAFVYVIIIIFDSITTQKTRPAVFRQRKCLVPSEFERVINPISGDSVMTWRPKRRFYEFNSKHKLMIYIQYICKSLLRKPYFHKNTKRTFSLYSFYIFNRKTCRSDFYWYFFFLYFALTNKITR